MNKSQKFYDKLNNRLVYIGSKSSSQYWDNHWTDKDFKNKIKVKTNKLITRNTSKYLNKGSKILEGGCGRGGNVYLLQNNGYDCIGIDYATETVSKINKLLPDLKVQIGDVRSLKFEDSYFDAYWSLGVIEHFYSGYHEIMKEMYRVLKSDGYLFMTVPTMSPLRILKTKMNCYPEWKLKETENFYQFALSPKQITFDFQKIGFELIEIKPYDGVKGLKDEISLVKKPLQYMYDSNNLFCKIARRALDILCKRTTSHMTLYIFKKVTL